MANRISVFVWSSDCDVHVLSQIIMYLKWQPCSIPYISAHTIMNLSQRKKKLKKSDEAVLSWYFWRWYSCSTMFLWIWHHFETESQLWTWFSFLFRSGLPQSDEYDHFSPTPELWWRERGHILILAQKLQMTKFFSVQFAFRFPGTNVEYVQTIILIWFPCLLFHSLGKK